MNSPWRSLGAAWGEKSPALVLWPQAAAGARDWQQALQHAKPGDLRIDAWPREPEVALLLEPLATSSLQPAAPATVPRPAADGGPRSSAAPREWPAGRAHAATSAAERLATSAPGSRWPRVGDVNSGAAAALPRSARLRTGLDGPLKGHADGTADSTPASLASALAPKLSPGAGTALVAAMLAQFSARQRPVADGPAAAASGVEMGLRPRISDGPAAVTQRLAAPAYGNVVPLRSAAGVPVRPRASAAPNLGAGGATKLRHWSNVLGWAAPGRAPSPSGSRPLGEVAADAGLRAGDASSSPNIGAWLARGEHVRLGNAEAPVQPQAGSPIGPSTATALLSAATPAASRAGLPATAEANSGHGASAWGTLAAAPPAPSYTADTLAGLTAALSRIENQLATASPAPAQAPTAPQWLSDDDTLAERIHGILRRQARRHGIATP